MCKELGGDNCDETYNEAKRKIEEATEESYRVSSQIGSVQNSAFETPDYEYYGDHYSFELTPTPDEEYYQNLNGDENQSEDEQYYDDTYESSESDQGYEEEQQQEDNSSEELFYEEPQDPEE